MLAVECIIFWSYHLKLEYSCTGMKYFNLFLASTAFI